MKTASKLFFFAVDMLCPVLVAHSFLTNWAALQQSPWWASFLICAAGLSLVRVGSGRGMD